MCRAVAGGAGGGGEGSGGGAACTAADERGGAAAQAQAERLVLRVGDNKTGYFGVALNKPDAPKPYQAKLKHGGTEVNLGSRSTTLTRGRGCAARCRCHGPGRDCARAAHLVSFVDGLRASPSGGERISQSLRCSYDARVRHTGLPALGERINPNGL